MSKKRVKGNLTIRLSLVPGRCRWCQCTDAKPCTENCSWVDRTHTLCSECWVFDTMLQTAKGRRDVILFFQETFWESTRAAAVAKGRRRRTVNRPRARPS